MLLNAEGILQIDDIKKAELLSTYVVSEFCLKEMSSPLKG